MDNNQTISEDLATGKVQTIYADPDVYAAVIKEMEANGIFDNNA